MPERFFCQRRVEFCETDAAGIAHFSSFLCYMEQAEHQFLRHLGTSVVQGLDNNWHLSWPRVHVECDFLGAVQFEDILQISIGILKLGTKSITYAFDFSSGEALVARGNIATVCCRVRVGEPLKSEPIPEFLRAKLVPYLVDASDRPNARRDRRPS